MDGWTNLDLFWFGILLYIIYLEEEEKKETKRVLACLWGRERDMRMSAGVQMFILLLYVAWLQWIRET